METITWTRPMLKRFIAAYEKAPDGSVFMFDGYEFIKEYARHLITFLEGRLNG